MTVGRLPQRAAWRIDRRPGRLARAPGAWGGWSRWGAWGLLALLCALAGCAGPSVHRGASAGDRQPCQIVFDAGSSGTRLFVYAKDGAGWREHAGPKTVALADPVRQIRGRTHADLEAVTTEVVAQLDLIARPGPPDSQGRPAWAGFDWAAHCRVTDAMVLATAGMRIAEHEDPAMSRALWASLKRKLQGRVGDGVRVAARTLTGFEEGLYAWLAVREGRADARFGIAEMGGASSQVTFPCPGCSPADDAVRTVLVQGAPVRMFSYSFLGLGQDEAPRTLGQPATCAHGVALSMPGWRPADCTGRIHLQAAGGGLRDPYNVAPDGRRGTQRAIPTTQGDLDGWVLTGAFNHMAADGVAQCCLSAGACWQAPSSCFRALYLETFLGALGIAPSAPRADVSWTHGAVLCAESQCLQQASPPPPCRWSAAGCLPG